VPGELKRDRVNGSNYFAAIITVILEELVGLLTLYDKRNEAFTCSHNLLHKTHKFSQIDPKFIKKSFILN
jgi:hypothetical protein